MASKTKKIISNVNKDSYLMDFPYAHPKQSQWNSKWSNYLTCNIGDIVPIYVDEVLPKEKRKVTMGMISHMTTPIAPIFNSQYTEFRAWFIPYRLCADLLAGYKTRKSPWVKVFGEDNASANANIIVPLSDQKLPSINQSLNSDFNTYLEPFGGVADALDCDSDGNLNVSDFNFLDFAAYELIYQKGYRNQNRESATNSKLYKWLFDIYNRANANTISYSGADAFHKANREKDYFTGSQPFTQKSSSPVTVGLLGSADVVAGDDTHESGDIKFEEAGGQGSQKALLTGSDGVLKTGNTTTATSPTKIGLTNLVADLSSASGVSIEQLRLMLKLQEELEKDSMYGSDYASFLNSRFGCSPLSLVLEEPLELKKTIITSQMQPIFQTSVTANEQTILGTIGANATTQSGEFEVVPLTEFKEQGLLIITAVHKAQNSYDAREYKPKRIFKKQRFDFYVPELNDLGYSPIQRKEFSAGNYDDDTEEAVAFNEAWAEYRFGQFNKVHGMFEPSRNNALDYWTLAMSNYADVEAMYKQGTTELDRAISVTSANAPQFFDAFGFIEYNDKPMSLHSIPGFDGVI